jgi:translation initiation factor IF-2
MGRAVLRQNLGEVDLEGVLIQADSLHTQEAVLRQLKEQEADFYLTV